MWSVLRSLPRTDGPDSFFELMFTYQYLIHRIGGVKDIGGYLLLGQEAEGSTQEWRQSNAIKNCRYWEYTLQIRRALFDIDQSGCATNSDYVLLELGFRLERTRSGLRAHNMRR